MKKNIYFVQANITQETAYMYYIPYAVGCLAAYSFAQDDIRDNYELKTIFYKREPINELIDAIEAPYLVAFSCAIWNAEYNKVFSQRIKEKWPDCLIVWGGHDVPEDTSYLGKYPYVDLLMFGECEMEFCELLRCLYRSGDKKDVGNLAYRAAADVCIRTPFAIHDDISDYPSPYLSGIFDKYLYGSTPDKLTDVCTILETNRGCPYRCAFCDWCHTLKARPFPMDKVKAEIDWMASHKIDYVYCADANFGILRRDIQIAQYVVDTKNRTGWPHIFKPCYAKGINDWSFEAGCILNLNKADKGVTIAYQTLDPGALKKINRSNLTLEHFSEIIRKFEKSGVPTYSELILGLPGETYDSFCTGMCRLLDAGQHFNLPVYNCQVYCNSLMGQEWYQQKYSIKVVHTPALKVHYTPKPNGVDEYFDIVIETADMPFGEWVKANMFAIVLQTCHNIGMLRCFALYLHFESGVSYYDFYTKLLDYFLSQPHSFSGGLICSMRDRYMDPVKADWTYQNDKFTGIGWYFEEGAFLEFACRRDDFFREIRPFLDSFSIDDEIFADLLKFQYNIIRQPLTDEIVLDLRYDWYNYFEQIYDGKYSPLQKAANTTYMTVDEHISDWSEYAVRVMLMGKRRNAPLCTNHRSTVNVVYKESGEDDN